MGRLLWQDYLLAPMPYIVGLPAAAGCSVLRSTPLDEVMLVDLDNGTCTPGSQLPPANPSSLPYAEELATALQANSHIPACMHCVCAEHAGAICSPVSSSFPCRSCLSVSQNKFTPSSPCTCWQPLSSACCVSAGLHSHPAQSDRIRVHASSVRTHAELLPQAVVPVP